ncbi:hypothetical protein EHS17_00910 [Rhodobacteraceae bacterium CH30]|nr:hypothetical protein EHS17_00910 [Rhodobacteraceae bacterium CH30]
MPVTAANIGLALMLLLYLLHGLWLICRSRSATGMAALLAAYFIAAILTKLTLPSLKLWALYLPLAYFYAVTGIASALWSLSSVRWTSKGLYYPEKSRKLGAYYNAHLAVHSGILLASLKAPEILTAYLLLPSLMVLLIYAAYRVLLAEAKHDGQTHWSIFVLLAITSPILLNLARQLLAPLSYMLGQP